jgi:hypothetical protein
MKSLMDLRVSEESLNTDMRLGAYDAGFVPLPENINFAGREKVFQRLVENLKPETGQQRRVALFGLGGVGLVPCLYERLKQKAN